MKAVLLSLSLLLVSCATQDRFEYQGVQNGCAIDAVVRQAAIKAKSVMDRHGFWAKILIIEYSDGGLPVGHAYCIFEDVEGTIWAYDWSGSRPLRWNTKNPIYIASQLKSRVSRAYFSDTLNK